MDSRKYIEIISIPFILLIIVNLLYPFFGYTAFSLFSNGIFSILSPFGIISSLIAIVIYSYVTWRIINEKGSTATEAAFAGAILSIFVSIVSYLVGVVATFLIIYLNFAPNSLFSTTMVTQFVAQYLNPLNLVLGVILGVIISFLGGFFGYIWGKIQHMLVPIAKSMIKEGKIERRNVKSIESTVRTELTNATAVMKNTKKKRLKKNREKKV